MSNYVDTPFEQLHQMYMDGWTVETLHRATRVSEYKLQFYKNTLFTDKEANNIAKVYMREMGE